VSLIRSFRQESTRRRRCRAGHVEVRTDQLTGVDALMVEQAEPKPARKTASRTGALKYNVSHLAASIQA